jgi:subtilisin family serine protease
MAQHNDRDVDPANQVAPALDDIYIVMFEELPLASYGGSIAGLDATAPQARGERRLNPHSIASRAYLSFLDGRHSAYLAAMTRRISRPPEVIFHYRAAGNGVAVRVTPDEAARIETLPGVIVVERNKLEPLATDRGPWFIGADAVWDGSVLPGAGNQGEGVTVGILDTGINQEHPSFSDAAMDGHTFANPLGSGTFVGWCAPGHPDYDPRFVCNDKLIGMYDFADAMSTENDGPIDDSGHGSHVASIAAGNAVDYNGDGAPDVSGVAPHANLVAYDVCGTGCPTAASRAAVDQAVLDGVVDIINFSIGGGDNPYNPADIDFFMLNATNAGLLIAASAGNSGPDPGTVHHLGPWMTTVANNRHDRTAVEVSLVDMSGGVTTPPAEITGRSRTLGYGPAAIVHAGDYDNGDANPELCALPFPPGTWSGEIVVCDSGGIDTLAMTGQNVLVGGAGAMVLANTAGGPSIRAHAHILPAIHVDSAAGDALRAWLAGGFGHTATLTDSVTLVDPGNGDVMGAVSSRGPNPAFDLLKPDVSAPGYHIYAATAGDFFDVEGLRPFEGPEFQIRSGTSMASPHVAGAAALVMSVHPGWTPAEVKSALMTTGVTSLLKEDFTTPADPFDMGAGRIDVSQAVQAGLLLHETADNFQAAWPGGGGDPKTLNLPSLTDSMCAGSCSWTRTFENALSTTAHWTVAGSGPAWITFAFTPSDFTLAPGASQTMTIEARVGPGSPEGTWSFAEVIMTATGLEIPDARMPVSVVTFAGGGAVPDGGEVPGQPLTLAKVPLFGEQLQWGSSCLTTDTAYAVYIGTLGDFSSHAQHNCSVGGTTLVGNLPADSYVLVVPLTENVEGSYGTDGAGVERSAAADPCLPQSFVGCE